MSDTIRSTRLYAPVDENGIPVVMASESSGDIVDRIRSTRLYFPVVRDDAGNTIPVVKVLGSTPGGTSDHTKLSNRDAADQHPISAITGLTGSLAGKLPKDFAEFLVTDANFGFDPSNPDNVYAEFTWVYTGEDGYPQRPYKRSIPNASTEQAGLMTKSAVIQLDANTLAIQSLQNQGVYIGISFDTKADLDAYVLPDSVRVNDFTYVQSDESKGGATTRYVVVNTGTDMNPVLAFVFERIETSAPIGHFQTGTAGLIVGSADNGANAGYVYAEADGRGSVIGWNALNVRIGATESQVQSVVDGVKRSFIDFALSNWTPRTSGLNGAIWSIARSDSLGLSVAVGEGNLLATSSDEMNWTAQTSPFNTAYVVARCDSVGLFIMAGAGGNMATSPDGVNWTSRVSSFGTSIIYAITWSESLGLFVAAGAGGKIATSPDGINWTQRTSGIDAGISLLASAWSDSLGLFVVVGQSGMLVTSPDGVNWTRRSVGSSASLWSATWSDSLGLFTIGGQSGMLATSPDGANWTPRTTGLGSITVFALAWSEPLGLFVAGGNSGKIATSPDGVNWTPRVSGFGTSVIFSLSGSSLGCLVAGGAEGKLATSLYI